MAGTDVFGRNTFGGGGMNSGKAVSVAQAEGTFADLQPVNTQLLVVLCLLFDAILDILPSCTAETLCEVERDRKVTSRDQTSLSGGNLACIAAQRLTLFGKRCVPNAHGGRLPSRSQDQPIYILHI